MTSEEDETISAALRALAAATEVPPPDAERERALLAAFDAATPRDAKRGWSRASWLASAAAILVVAFVGYGYVGHPFRGAGRADGKNPPPHESPAVEPDVSRFVPWPGASTLPPFEGGALVRTELPVSMLPSLGLAPSPSDAGTVQADVIVGQDGLARAVRLVP